MGSENPRRKCFVSFKHEDIEFREQIVSQLDVDLIDKSLREPIDSNDEDYIMRKIREDYLSDSTVTIHLIGEYSAEILGWDEQRFIIRELQASLYHRSGNTRNGVLGVVLPTMLNRVYRGSASCATCSAIHNHIIVDDSTTVKEFSANYYIPHDKCAWSESDRYCVLTQWHEFVEDPKHYIELAYGKRFDAIADKIRVRPAR